MGQAAPLVVFVNPDRPGNPFWDKVTTVMQAAAKDLELTLEVRYGDTNREQSTRQALDAIQSDPPADYLVYIYQVGQARRILEAAEQAGVRSIIFNTDVADQDRDLVGSPGEVYTQWIAHLVPDDFHAGADLASRLIAAARTREPERRAELVGFNGGRDSSAARARAAGLEDVLSRREDAVLHQVLVSQWDALLAAEQTEPLLRRWPGTNVVWAASDAMALAVAGRLTELGRKPGLDVFLGGIDWTDEGIRAVADGRLVVTLGGHFMDGAWALVVAHDHALNLVSATELRRVATRLQAIDRENVQQYQELLDGQHWQRIDFQRYSRRQRGPRAPYEFGLDTPP